MKTFKVLFGLLMVLVMISGSAASAQEVDSQATGDNEPLAVNLVTEPFNIAGSSVVDFGPPAVAYGHGYFMVVFESDGAIIGVVYNTAGDWQHTHTITEYGGAYPSVAYEAQSGLFVVAYEFTYYKGWQNIHVFAVSPTEGKLESGRPIAFSSYDETRPSVACNHTKSTCLVAFEHSQESRIKGGFVSVSDGGITEESIPRNLTAATSASRPKLAWGMDSGYYMITYNWKDPFFKEHAMYNKVYDYPVPGSQHIHTNEYVVPEGNILLPNNTFDPDVAYDPCTEKFVIAFSHFLISNYDVWAVAKNSTDAATGFSPFDVAVSGVNERSPAISFVKGDHLSPSCGPLDKLVVTYQNTDRGIMAADLRGNNSKTDPVYSVSDQIVVARNDDEWDQRSPAISSGSHLAEMFIAYQKYWKNHGDHDIWGRIVEVMEYLLSVSKEGMGDGTVYSFPGYEIDCGPVCEYSFPNNSIVHLMAVPSTDSWFTGWEGDCSGTDFLCELMMDDHKEVIAIFNEFDYPLLVEKSVTGDGIVTSDPEGIDCGDDCEAVFPYDTRVKLSATPSPGSEFVGWEGDCSGMTCEVTMDSPYYVIANFEQVHTLSVNINGTGDGGVTSDPQGIECGEDCEADFPYDTRVTLSATPLPGSEFVGWEGDCSGMTCQLIMDGNKSVTAVFAEMPDVFNIYLPLILR